MNKPLLILLLMLPVLPASASGMGGMFGQGRTQFSLGAGNGYAFDNNYFVIGAGVSHFVLDGVGVGLSLEKWSGGGPGITKYSPFAQYVFYWIPDLQPYVGGFYRHAVIEGLPNINSVGVRGGIYIASTPNTYVSVGIVYESYLDCQQSIYQTCSETYPDLGLIFAF